MLKNIKTSNHLSRKEYNDSEQNKITNYLLKICKLKNNSYIYESLVDIRN